MNPDLSQKAIDTIESLCQLGCTQVNQLIDDAKNGKDIKELAGFSHSEQDMIIDELGDIMSVYDEK
jgi:hypothetical protein